MKKKLSRAEYVVTSVGEKQSFVVNTDRLAKYVERPNELKWHDVTANEEEVFEDTDSEGFSAVKYEVDLAKADNIDKRRSQ